MFFSPLATTISALTLLASAVHGAALTKITSFGNNPTNIEMYVYVPDKVASNPPIVVAVHGCLSSAQYYFTNTQLPAYADKYGFVLVYPSTPNDNHCWDIHTKASTTHDGGGDSTGIASMVKYALRTYKGNSLRVYIVGTSSGGMQTNNMAATYPNMFSAAASFSGVPYGCMYGANSSSPISPDAINAGCANGLNIKTGAEWGAMVHKAFPVWLGSYPRMLIAHGTADTLVTFPNYNEQMKEWSNVHKVSFVKNVTDTPLQNYTMQVYGDGKQLVGYIQHGGVHVVPVQEEVVLKFFGIITG